MVDAMAWIDQIRAVRPTNKADLHHTFYTLATFRLLPRRWTFNHCNLLDNRIGSRFFWSKI